MFRVSGVVTETPKNSSFSSSREEEKAPFDRAYSSQEVNIFIREQLQSDEEFHRLYNDAFDSLYKGLQRNLENTVSYEIHNLIEVSGATLLPTPPERKTPG